MVGIETQTDEDSKLLSAIERVVATPDQVLEVVARLREEGPATPDELAAKVISYYSRRAALVGGATALPALLPIGLVASLVAGPMADMVLLLKLELEMALALAAVHGHPIHDPRERRQTLLLVAIRTASDGSLVNDGVDLAEAVWGYAPRRVGKLLVTTLAQLSLVLATRRAASMLPVVGVAIGAGLNGVLSSRVGRQVHADLRQRRWRASNLGAGAPA